MKVHTRLTYSHGIIVVTLITVCVLSVLMCRSFRDMIHDIVSNRYLKTIYLDDVGSAVSAIDLSINKLLLSHDNNTIELENIDKSKKTIIENVSRLEPLVNSDKGKLLLKKIIDTQEAYFSDIREQTNAILFSHSNESKKLLIGKQSVNSAIFRQAVSDLTDHQTMNMRAGESEANITYHEYMVMAMSVTGGLILISFLIGIRVIRSLVKELGAEPEVINEILMNIADDNLHHDYELLRGKNQRGIIKYISILLDNLREREALVKSELALGEELAENNLQLQQRERLQDTIKNVLEISLEQVPLKNKLDRVLDIIVSIPGLSIENKGCIHLKVDNADELTMISHKNLHESLVAQCAHLKYGQCLCGLAASIGKTVFSNKLDDLHTVTFEGIHEHGHYCIPIKSGSIILGVLCLYVRYNHERSKLEEDTFIAITNSIAAIIETGKREDDIRRINRFTHTVINSINDSIIVIDVKDLTVVSTNYAFLKEYRVLEYEVIGKHCYAVTHKVSEPCNQLEYSCPVMTMLRTGEHAVSEHLHYDSSGNEIYVSCSASPIRDDAGNIVQSVYVLKNISQRKYYEKQLQQLAHYDVVTSLPNRILLLDRLNIAIEFCSREGNLIALLFIDLDKFKAVNDTFGHETGDMLLKEVSQRLLSAVRKSDTVSRVGGDEFVVILTKVNSKEDAGSIADKIIVSLNKPFSVNGHECRIGGSIGIEIYPFSDANSGNGNITDVLIKRADTAMYRAKEHGKNRYEYYSSEMSSERENPLFV